MQRDYGIGLAIEAKALPRIGAFDLLAEHFERVDHDVADTGDLLRRDAFRAQVGVRIRRRCPQQIGDRVGDEAIDLLRHPAIAAA